MTYVMLSALVVVTYLLFLCLSRVNYLIEVVDELHSQQQVLYQKLDAESIVTQDLNDRLQRLQSSRFSQMGRRGLNRMVSR